jgi:hypothetical protein
MVSVQEAKVNTRVHGVGASGLLAIALIAQAQASEGKTTVSVEVVKVHIRVHDAGELGQSAIARTVVELALAEKAMVSAEAEEASTFVRGATEKDSSSAAAHLCVVSPHFTRSKNFKASVVDFMF